MKHIQENGMKSLVEKWRIDSPEEVTWCVTSKTKRVFADFSRDPNAPMRDQNSFRYQMMDFLLGALWGSFYIYEICFSSEVFSILLYKEIIDFLFFFWDELSICTFFQFAMIWALSHGICVKEDLFLQSQHFWHQICGFSTPRSFAVLCGHQPGILPFNQLSCWPLRMSTDPTDGGPSPTTAPTSDSMQCPWVTHTSVQHGCKSVPMTPVLGFCYDSQNSRKHLAYWLIIMDIWRMQMKS